jgi:hypothetical protein
MKKIHSLKELKEEKSVITHRRRKLEEQIGNNWNDLKIQLRPVNMAKDAFNGMLNRKTREADKANGGILKSALSYGAWLLTRKMMDRAEDRINRVFKK